MYSHGSPHMAAQNQDDQHERTFSSYVRIRDVVLKTYLGRWTIGRSCERGSGISVLPARYDDDDDKLFYLLFLVCLHIVKLLQELLCKSNNLTPVICLHTFKSSSSSSSYRAGSTDIPDPLSQLLPIVHRPR